MATARVSGASLGSGWANKIDVRHTSNCAIRFSNLWYQQTASCAKVKIPAVAKLCGLGPGRKSVPSGAAEMPGNQAPALAAAVNSLTFSKYTPVSVTSILMLSVLHNAAMAAGKSPAATDRLPAAAHAFE